ncbi:cytochrome P450 [Obba rivulosa]|uniref:Cytochrome P450 n=1 Tax=Obba rivulosa TaxID=1052685 RepID=A0A8E2AWT2_9APHY|nr:cytochrome P450 [Obba rivulosa]
MEQGVWKCMAYQDCFGSDILMLTDPKALQHICQKSGYEYPKDNRLNEITRLSAGDGLVAAIGHAHIRQRNVMTPSFSTTRLRDYVSLFQRTASKVADKWKTEFFAESDGPVTIPVNHWLPRATLDIIGEAVCSYSFGTLDNENTELADAYANIFADSLLIPSRIDVLFKATWKYFPMRLLHFVEYLPTREYRRFRGSLKIMKRIGGQIIDEKIKEDTPRKRKDIVDVMIDANTSFNPKQQVSRDELTDQMATLMLAGHETTATSLNYILWELAKRPEYQAKIREEIDTLRNNLTRRGESEYTIEDLESMKYTVAVVKETMRLHPILYHTTREAARDDIIPLSEPIKSRTGELIKNISISKGQLVLLSFWGYNRVPAVWGEDADTWNPKRFLDSDVTRNTNVGLYANLLTFSAGVRGCIGWRFAVLEILSFLVELLEHFKFNIPPEKLEIMRVPAGAIMTPFIRDNMHLGPMMPLQVIPIQNEYA